MLEFSRLRRETRMSKYLRLRREIGFIISVSCLRRGMQNGSMEQFRKSEKRFFITLYVKTCLFKFTTIVNYTCIDTLRQTFK